MKRFCRFIFNICTAPVFSIIFFFLAFIARVLPKKTDVGIGPEPLINNVYHKMALQREGYSAETYASHTYYITKDFDIFIWKSSRFLMLKSYLFFVRNLFVYRVLYIYFNGGPLAWTPLKYLEAFYYRLARVKIVVMPYGGDIQQNQLTPNLLYRNAYAKDYPQFQKIKNRGRHFQTIYWQRFSHFVLGGCDWVDYLYHWDKLVLAHFSCDYSKSLPSNLHSESDFLTVLHAPNHKEIKGTRFLVNAVNSMQKRGLKIRLEIAQQLDNQELKKRMNEVDVIVDQLVIGWYGMFGVEAMSLKKPVVAFMRPDLIRLYFAEGLLTSVDEIPIVNADIFSIEKVLENLLENKKSLAQIGERSFQFFIKHHSIDAIGRHFKEINLQILGR